jgi:type II secretory ATPase GspE/PulE/Tfp pilus assembly ATPase PilB-like protein
LEAGLIDEAQLSRALADQAESNERLGRVFTRLKMVTEDDVARILSDQLEIPVFDPGQHKVSAEALSMVPGELARKYNLLPVHVENGSIQVAMADPLNLDALDDLRVTTGRSVQPMIGPESVVTEARERHYSRLEGSREVQEALDLASIALGGDERDDEDHELDAEEAKRRSEDAPIINLVDQMIGQAIKEGATDIHVEPYERNLVIRYRVDGLLYDAVAPPRKVYTGVITRIKILADMDIAERRAPQGGRLTKRMDGREVDIRVSTVPTIHGEKAVLRLLDKTDFSYDFTSLGFEARELDKFHQAIRQPYGMILLSGPTGSGKSTTLYAALQEIRDTALNIMTVEDPVEYHMSRINQIQVNPRKNVTFASALRTFLRQDPDVIMVGEIRDQETAEIAVRAAMTGHMVHSTIHANDAPSTAVRLVSLGVEPFQAASAMTLVAAQRLVRRVCTFCAEPYRPAEEMLLPFHLHPEELEGANFMRGMGCGECKDRGYRGRTALLELMVMDRDLRDMVAEHAPADSLRREAIAKGMKTLKQGGLAKAMRGETTVEEVLRVCLEED